MNYLEAMEIGHCGRDSGELNIFDQHVKARRLWMIRLANCKRFALGLNPEYCNILPFCIHSVRMRKRCGSVEIETPSRRRILGWDKCFQIMISRHKC